MTRPEGWKLLYGARKWHYFRNGTSLCGHWMTLNDNGMYKNSEPSAADCKVCRRKLEA